MRLGQAVIWAGVAAAGIVVSAYVGWSAARSASCPPETVKLLPLGERLPAGLDMTQFGAGVGRSARPLAVWLTI